MVKTCSYLSEASLLHENLSLFSMNYVEKVLRVAKSRSSNQINIAHVREISPLIRNTGQNRPFQSIAEL